MAITETRPETATETHTNPWDTGEEYPAVAVVLGTGDHKTLGRFYIGFALLFGIVAWVLQGLVTLDAAGTDVLGADTTSQIFTLGRLSLVLLFAIPLLVGVATVVVPLQVGASTIAFPRAAAAAFWTWLLGSVLLLIAYSVNGGVGGGRPKGVDLAYLAIGVTTAALLLASICVMTTIVALRAPGMYLDRVPMFSWGMFVAGAIWLVSLPVFLANVLLIYVDHHFGRPTDFGVALNQWPQLSWLFEQPQVFAFAIPVLGALGDIVATSAGVRQRNRGFMLTAVGAFGVLSFGAFAQPYFNEDVWEQVLFVVVGVVLLIPLLLLVAGWATTMMQGRPRITTASVGGLLAALVLILAALGSALYVIRPLRLQPNDRLDLPLANAFQTGLLALVVGAVSVGAIAALHFWSPKVTGRLANDGLGKILVLVGFAGSVLAGLPLCVLGFANRWDRLADAADALYLVSAAGAALLAVAVLLAGLNVLAASRGPRAEDDPWGGQTLEWATPSPPPTGNFGELPRVESAEPLLDVKEAGS
ncbi:cbb3-type cytochrome c oxidase subunit I [Rhabdothermincola sp.]|uniref:cbb3-type cytochrome c oxidase subunit I n=1 Tax=Rhabdothermincola sp. TaxID=2820405 RepID=UPI002FE10AD1